MNATASSAKDPFARNAEHRPGCPATGGYGHGVESCICGAVADVEQLPLPEPAAGYGRGCNIELADGQPLYTAEQATAHAHAVAEHNVAERDAEIEALRAEVNTAKGQAEFYRTERNKNQQKAERLAEALRLVETAKDRGFGIDYAQGVAKSTLRDHDQEVK